MSLGHNVKLLREHRGWELKDLTRASGVKEGTISALAQRSSEHSRYAPQLARAFGITVEQLLDDEFVNKLVSETPVTYHMAKRRPYKMFQTIKAAPESAKTETDVVISQFDTGGSMGRGVLLKDQPGVIREWCVSEEWLHKNVNRISSPSNLAIVTGFGDSMRGMFNPGDPLLVDTGIGQFEGDAVYFFRVDDEGFVKRLQRIPGEGLVVISENKAYRDWTIKAGMDFQVFGKVVKVWKGEEF